MTTQFSQRGIAMPIVILIVAAVVIGGGAILYAITNKSADDTSTPAGDVMEKKDEAMIENEEGDAMVKKEEDAMVKKDDAMLKYSGAVLAGTNAPLLDFTQADYEAALKSDKLVVLYFYANWCPICKEEVANSLYPAFNELTTDKVVGIRINYKDSETDSEEKALAVQFGIPYQHTKVLLKNGKQILKAPDSWNKMRYLDEINKAIAQ